MLKLSLKASSARKVDLKTLNILVAENHEKRSLEKLSSLIPAVLKSRFKAGLKAFTSEKSFVESFPTTEGGAVVFVSKAPGQSLSLFHESLRESLVSFLKKEDLKRVLLFSKGNPSQTLLEEIGILSHVARWKHPKRKSLTASPESPQGKLQIEIWGQKLSSELKGLFEQAQVFGEAISFVKTLSHTPPNFLTPTDFARVAQDMAKKHKWGYEFLNEAKLKKLGAGAFLAVSQGSSKRDSGIVHITVNPGRKRKVSFVGKGICFDTGGYNVKTGNYMFNMHQDMTGAANALAMAFVCHHLKLDAEVHVYLALAENHISPEAFKMNEVVFALNGKSIEVIHTDAEGRMVLSDTLALASQDKPSLMIDFATLTGSAIRALGTKRAAVFCSEEEALARLLTSAQETGEEVWPFPQGHEYEEALKSKIADLKQCDSGSNADHIYATTFLSKFVDPKIHWVHMDLSPVDGKGVGLLAHDGCGFGLRWAYRYTL